MAKLETNNIDIRDALFDEVYDIASKDKNVIFITADADAFSLRKYKKDFPEQFINIGVAEQNMVAVASGLALSGKKVFIYAIIPFIVMRCYEHIKANICSMNLPVTIIGAGAGLSFGNDGPTHHAVQDIALMRTLPEMTILNPCDSQSAIASVQFAHQQGSPAYIRLDKGVLPSFYNEEDNFSDGLKVIKECSDINIISTGFMSQKAVEIARELEKHSLKVGVVDLYKIKPVNETPLLKIIDWSKKIITLEENSIVGGIGTIISEILTDNKKQTELLRLALKDEQCFCYGTRDWLHESFNLDVASVVKTILDKGSFFEKNSNKITNFDKELTVNDFARSFGTTVDNITNDCRELIEKIDFRYRIIKGDERDNVIFDVLKKIETDKQIIGAPKRTDEWEKGWHENLEEFVESNYDLNKTIPKFIRPNQPIRLNQQYIMPADSNFEHDYFDVFRTWLFKKYLEEFDPIYDFGSGSGFNLIKIAEMYPEKTLHGLDFVSSSCELINKIAETHNWKMKGHIFNLRSPDDSFKIESTGAVFTSGVIEQVASDFEPFLRYLLKHPPGICIHIEPTIELYDEHNLVDSLAIKFHKKRGYTEGFLPRLKKLEKEDKIKILKVKRLFFGSLFLEGFNLIIWKPRP